MIDLFLMSKPVHLLHILNIKKVVKHNQSILVVVNNFNNAYDFFKSIKGLNLFLDVYFVSHEDDVPSLLVTFDINNIYYNWDHGPDVKSLLAITHKSYYLYDDGFFSYVDNFEQGGLITSTLRRFYRCLKGERKLRLGYSSDTKGIYLYYPKSFEFYHNDYPNEVYPMPVGFIDAMTEFKNVFNAIYKNDFNYNGIHYKKVAVYVTDKSNDFKENIDGILKKNDVEKLYVKLHPHIKTNTLDIISEIDIIDSSLPVEFILLSIFSNCEKLIVYHHNSSAGFHMEGYKGVEIINLGRDDLLTKKFNQLTTHIKGEAFERKAE